MYNLLPLVIFNHRKILRKIAANKDMLEEEKKQLLEEINRLSHEIDRHRAEYEGEDIHKIALAITNISEYLNSKYIKDEHFGEEVFLMTKTLYDPIVEQRGEQRGEQKKAIEIAIALLDVLDDVTIALKTGLSQDEVTKLREENQ